MHGAIERRVANVYAGGLVHWDAMHIGGGASSKVHKLTTYSTSFQVVQDVVSCPNIGICSDSANFGPFLFLFLLMGASEAKGRGAGGSAGGASLAPINKNREHDWPCFRSYIDHKWPNHYNQRCLRAYRPKAWNHYNQRCLPHIDPI